MLSSVDNLPPTTDTKARASTESASALTAVNLIASPTLYPVPELSTKTSLTPPEVISPTSAETLPLPIAVSTVRLSPLL